MDNFYRSVQNATFLPSKIRLVVRTCLLYTSEHIRKVRAKLSAKTLHNYIETVWGVGYRWNG